MTDEIAKFGKKVCNSTVLEYIMIQPDINATFNNCFLNLVVVVKAKGKALILGWTIWKWKNILIEAEAHAIC